MKPRTILSWTLYWVGDAISRTIEPLLGNWFEFPHRTYARIMVWAYELQDGDPQGPWTDAPLKDGE